MRFRFDPHIAFRVRDHDQAVEFYRRVFGMQVVGRSGEETKLRLGDTYFYVERGGDDPAATRAGPVATHTWLAFTVDDLDAARAAFVAEGCEVREHAEGGEVGLLVVDPYGLKCFVAEEGGS